MVSTPKPSLTTQGWGALTYLHVVNCLCFLALNMISAKWKHPCAVRNNSSLSAYRECILFLLYPPEFITPPLPAELRGDCGYHNSSLLIPCPHKHSTHPQGPTDDLVPARYQSNWSTNSQWNMCTRHFSYSCYRICLLCQWDGGLVAGYEFTFLPEVLSSVNWWNCTQL